MKVTGIKATLLLIAACGSTQTTTTSEPSDAAMGNLQRAERALAEFDAEMSCSGPTTTEELAECMQREVRRVSQDADRVVAAFDEVLRHHDAAAAVAALSGQGQTYAMMANAIVAMELPSPLPLPQAVQDQGVVGGLDIQTQLVDTLRAALDEKAQGAICRAVLHDVRALRAATEASIEGGSVNASKTRLSHLGEAEIARCITQHSTGPDAVQPYSPGEFGIAHR